MQNTFSIFIRVVSGTLALVLFNPIQSPDICKQRKSINSHASETFEVEEGEVLDLQLTTSLIPGAPNPPPSINITFAHTNGTPPLDARKNSQ